MEYYYFFKSSYPCFSLGKKFDKLKCWSEYVLQKSNFLCDLSGDVQQGIFYLFITHQHPHACSRTKSHWQPHTHTLTHTTVTHLTLTHPFSLPFSSFFAASPSSPFSCSMTRKDFDIVWHWKKNSSLGSPHWFKACFRIDTCTDIQSGLLDKGDLFCLF